MKKSLIKKVSYGLLAIPIGFLLLFTFGEVFSGDFSGFSHLLQIVPIVLLMLLIHKKPLVGESIIAIIGLFFGIFYIVRNPSNVWAIIIVESLLFLPLFISGLIIVFSSKDKKFF